MGKIFARCAAFGTICLFSGLPCLAQDQADQKASDSEMFKKIARGFGVSFSLGFGLNTDFSNITISNVPTTLRTIPSNQYGPGTIGSPVIAPDSPFALKKSEFGQIVWVRMGPQYTLWRFTVRGGVSIPMVRNPTDNKPQAGVGPYSEINDIGTSERGYGRSLAYYAVYWEGKTSHTPKPFGEVEFIIHPLVTIGAGYSHFQSSAGITLETGYDQFDKLTPLNTRQIASAILESSFYGKVKANVFGPYANVFLEVGPVNHFISSAFPISTGSVNQKEIRIFYGMEVILTQAKKIKH